MKTLLFNVEQGEHLSNHIAVVLALASDLTVAAGVPVFALPTNCSAPLGSDAALIAWDGSQEASHAVRHALPMLKAASKITVVEMGKVTQKNFPAWI